jgi:UDP-N-acetylglucosamine 2-epimerase (non-hydrolysing)
VAMVGREAMAAAAPIRVLCVAGTRPNFVKIAPLLRAFRARPLFDARLVHTGQHHDPALSEMLFDDLALPPPHAHLGVGAGTQAEQTAEIMRRFEPVASAWQPHVVLVVGDVTSTLACALVAAKMTLHQSFATSAGRRRRPLLVHVEAGLRSFDDTMPEELNRRLTDALSDLLYVSEPSGLVNLRREGIPEQRAVLVGNVMIDSLLADGAGAAAVSGPSEIGGEGPYGVVTVHRPANVDDPDVLENLLRVLDDLATDLPLVFPVHPRTWLRLQSLSLRLESPRWRLLAPLGYRAFTRLLASARLVLTDSGGIQEETTFLGVPCLTLRPSTERPITLEQGTNVLVGTNRHAIEAAFRRALAGSARGPSPALWDGRAADRIADHLLVALGRAPEVAPDRQGRV